MAAEGRVILFSSHILEEVERLADAVLVVYAGRLAASGDFRSIRRLMTDRPHRFTIRSSDDRALATALLGQPSVFGAELVDGLLAVRTSDFGAFTRIVAPTARAAGIRLHRGHADRRLPRERLQLPGPPMTAFTALVTVTVRGLLGRRRVILLLLLAALPVLVGLLIRLGGGRPDAAGILDTLGIRTVLPLVALVIGTAVDRLRGRGRDARLPAGEADRALADRPRQDPRRRRADDRAHGAAAHPHRHPRRWHRAATR